MKRMLGLRLVIGVVGTTTAVAFEVAVPERELEPWLIGGPVGPWESHTPREEKMRSGYEPGAIPPKRRSTIDALWPPKPDEFETATPTSASRASFGT